MRGADFRAVDIAPAPHALVATLDAVAGLLGPTGLVVGVEPSAVPVSADFRTAIRRNMSGG